MIGGGYVGLVSGACFAKFGSNVAVVEADPAKLEALRTGHRPIYEPGLDQLVAENVKASRLLFTDDLPAALKDVEAVFIAVTGIEAAELTKYAANSFLAMKVTFINEMVDLCEKVGADVHDVARGIGLDGRIGRKFLHPGPGFGGSCFPKDTLALVRIAQEYGAPSRLVESVVAVNDARKAGMAARVIAACRGSVRGKTIAVLGLTFKPETDDMRDAPSIPIVPGWRKTAPYCGCLTRREWTRRGQFCPPT
jgi:UDP-glucose 6-dehydrogenase